MAQLRIMTGGTGIENQFPLSQSVHLSVSIADKEHLLNHGFGMLFADGIILTDNTIDERILTAPGFVHAAHGYAIAAQRTDLQGRETDAGRLLLWQTDDFEHFTGPVLADAAAYPEYGPSQLTDTVDIPQEMAEHLLRRWPPAPETEAALFPLANGYADPVLLHRNGAWYFIATNDNTGDIGLFIRRSDTMLGLFAPDATEHCILDRDEQRDLIQTFWAPELHEIGGRMYILMAIGGREWAPQCRMLRLREGGDMTCADDWEAPVMVVRSDGSPLAPNGISLDMTYFHTQSGHYLCWSYREHIGSALDSGSMLMIARIDPREPWQLLSEPVLLSRPLYAWENRGRTINNEGPYALCAAGRIYLYYSGGAAGGESYAVGCLVADACADLTDPSAWEKSPMPLLHSRRVANVYGPGHHAFFTDEKGDTWISYHAQTAPDDRTRRTGIHRVYFAPDGSPILDLHRR